MKCVLMQRCKSTLHGLNYVTIQFSKARPNALLHGLTCSYFSRCSNEQKPEASDRIPANWLMAVKVARRNSKEKGMDILDVKSFNALYLGTSYKFIRLQSQL